MDRATRELSAMLIRLLRGVLSAWEKWLNEVEAKESKKDQQQK